MKGPRSSIQSRLTLTAIGITAMLIAIGVITNHYLHESFSHYNLLNKIDRVNNHEIRLRKIEKDFLLEESINPEFYKSGTSKSQEAFRKNIRSIQEHLRVVSQNEIISEMGLKGKIDKVEKAFTRYKRHFEQLTQTTLKKGFKDWGTVGKMRDQIHAVESIVEKNDRLLLTKYMLSLRRREKDYLLRKDLKYHKRFNQLIEEFISELRHGKASDFQKSEQLIKALGTYKKYFGQVISNDIRIGFTRVRNTGEQDAVSSLAPRAEGASILEEIKSSVEVIETNLSQIHNQIYDEARREIQHAVVTLFIILALLSGGILFVLLLDTRHITRSVKRLESYLDTMSQGEIPQIKEVKNKDEIGSMEKSLQILSQNLRNTRDFAIEVGNGNLESEVNVFNNQGALGSKLQEMRQKLLQVARERQQQEAEANRRIWINEGVSKFSALLRENKEDLTELSYQIISTLVHYLEANQGGLFLKNEDESDGVFFDLVAAYAYNRRKFIKKQIRLNEGLVGTCAIEKQTIYMTDLPENYIHITSGLGEAPPRSLLLVPLKTEEEVLGVVEVASFQPMEDHHIQFVEKIAADVASHLYSFRINQRTSELLEKTQQQAEEMKSQEEEMRQNMEELKATQEQLSQREKELTENLKEKEAEINRLNQQAIARQNELEHHESMMKSLVEGLNAAMIMAEFDPDGKMLSSNQIFRKNFLNGNDPEDTSLWNALIPEDQQHHFRDFWQDIVDGQSYCGNQVVKNVHDQNLWLYTTFIPLSGPDKRTNKVVLLSKTLQPVNGNNGQGSGKTLDLSPAWQRQYDGEEDVHEYLFREDQVH